MVGPMKNQSRYCERAYTNMPDRVFLLFHGCDNWQQVMPPPAVPHPVLIPKASLAPQFAGKRSLACVGTPLLSQQIALVPAPAAPN